MDALDCWTVAELMERETIQVAERYGLLVVEGVYGGCEIMGRNEFFRSIYS